MADDDSLKVIYAAEAGEVAIFAAQELARSLGVMTGAGVAAVADLASAATPALGPYLRMERGRPTGGVPAPSAAGAEVATRPGRDGFALRREAVPARGACSWCCEAAPSALCCTEGTTCSSV